MATPKGLQAASTPKNPQISTPSRPTASPRPYPASFSSKSLAYKSPAVKTPTSLQGHSHRVSISSHPTSTPLAAPAIHDELLNLNSPAAALIASIGNTGLTPIATGQDGLGITAGLTQQPVRDGPVPSRNPEVEKLNRLEEIKKLLKSKVAGRGVTREGVERIAQIHGFTILWDEENLTIAGNKVDLEIIFDPRQQDTVRDVQLRLNISGSEEPQLQKEASEILKQHLKTTGDENDGPVEAWKSLERFSHDLEYLSQLDYIDSDVNCFELVSGLYSTFRKIWDEEKKRMQDRHKIKQLCRGNVGKPSANNIDRLGPASQFWVNRQDFYAVADDLASSRAIYDTPWVARFSCTKGTPGISVGKEWLEEAALKTTVTTEDVFQENEIGKPNWANIGISSAIDEQQKNDDPMMLDGPGSDNSSISDLVFSCHLDNEVMIPVNVTNGLNSQYSVIHMEQRRTIVYQQALFGASEQQLDQALGSNIRRFKSLPCFSNNGQCMTKSHAYSFSTKGVPWSYPVRDITFSHPKQFADLLPVLRQYILLWSLLRNTIVTGTVSHKTQSEASVVKHRSNKKPAQVMLEDLTSTRHAHNIDLDIDISLDLVTDASKARVQVIVPLNIGAVSNGYKSYLHINIDVLHNGVLEISLLEILPTKASPSMERVKLKERAQKVLGLCEDVSLLIEWLLSELG